MQATSRSYRTKTGDTLYSVAKKNGVNWLTLYNLNTDVIRKAGGSMSVLPANISLQIPEANGETASTTPKSSSSAVLKKAASAVKTTVSRVPSNMKSIVSKIPTKQVTKASSTAAKKTVESVLSKS